MPARLFGLLAFAWSGGFFYCASSGIGEVWGRCGIVRLEYCALLAMMREKIVDCDDGALPLCLFVLGGEVGEGVGEDTAAVEVGDFGGGVDAH